MAFEENIAELYMQLLERAVKDKFRGHQDMSVMLDSIHEQVPMVGGEINIQKQDREGNFYTQTYHVAVKDDLGNILKSLDDIGGQCRKGEIAKKGSIFTCMECGELFCRKHIKFVDNDVMKPLCRYGLMGWEGCYTSHARAYSDGGIAGIEKETDKLIALTEREKAEQQLKALKQRKKRHRLIGGMSALQPRSPRASQRQSTGTVQRRRTGTFQRFLHGDVYKVKCGHCGDDIYFADIVCSECRNIISIDIDSALKCPVCGAPVMSVQCRSCEATNTL